MDKEQLSASSAKERLAERWDTVAERAKRAGCGRTGVVTLATRLGLEWYRARGDEPLGFFLERDGKALLELHGFGRRKMGRLCEIVETAVDDLGEDFAEVVTVPADPLEALATWEIPDDFPCRLIILPFRVIGYCARQGLDGLRHLLEEWERLGFDGFEGQKNLGVRSVRRLEAMVNAFRDLDHKTASLFLPLDPSGRGLSLGQALRLVAMDPNPSERSLLKRRLVERMTLEESAEEDGLTRERVRQVEAKFLKELSERLDYFSSDYAKLLAAWVAGGEWFEPLRYSEQREDDVFLAAALEAVFRDTPQAVARALGEDARLEGWHEELINHPDLWFGGVLFSEFLATRVPTQDLQLFCEHVAESPLLRLDQGDGRIYPMRKGLRRTIEAMVAMEDDPIPLTWLVDLLIRSGHHPSATRERLLRHRPVWQRRPSFPYDKILWSE